MRYLGYLTLILCCSCGSTDQSADQVNDSLLIEPDSVITAIQPNLDTLSSDEYLVYIDSLVEANKFESTVKSDSPTCGGDTKGCYYQGDLVYITATQTEKYGYIKRECYLRDSVVYRIVETIHAPLPEWGIPQPDREPDSDENPQVTCDEIRTITMPEKKMTIFRDGKEIFYYPESHDYILENNVTCATEMRQKLEASVK